MVEVIVRGERVRSGVADATVFAGAAEADPLQGLRQLLAVLVATGVAGDGDGSIERRSQTKQPQPVPGMWARRWSWMMARTLSSPRQTQQRPRPGRLLS